MKKELFGFICLVVLMVTQGCVRIRTERISRSEAEWVHAFEQAEGCLYVCSDGSVDTLEEVRVSIDKSLFGISERESSVRFVGAGARCAYVIRHGGDSITGRFEMLKGPQRYELTKEEMANAKGIRFVFELGNLKRTFRFDREYLDKHKVPDLFTITRAAERIEAPRHKHYDVPCPEASVPADSIEEFAVSRERGLLYFVMSDGRRYEQNF